MNSTYTQNQLMLGKIIKSNRHEKGRHRIKLYYMYLKKKKLKLTFRK